MRPPFGSGGSDNGMHAGMFGSHVDGSSGLEIAYVPLTRGYFGSGTISANTILAVPFVSPDRRTVTVNSMIVKLVVGGYGYFRLGIYKRTSEIDIYPDERIFGSSEVSTSSTGIKTVSVSTELERSTIYWAVILSNLEITIRSTDMRYSYTYVVSKDLSMQCYHLGGAYTYGALPSTFPSSIQFYSSDYTIPSIGITFLE